jgi:hypothetical protein
MGSGRLVPPVTAGLGPAIHDKVQAIMRLLSWMPGPKAPFPPRSSRRLLRPLILLVAAHAFAPAAAEGSSAPHGEGGYVPEFTAIVRRYNASGEPLRIEGVCKSACTLFLGIRNVRVERGATLVFHAGHDIAKNVTGPDTRASRAMLSHYNEALRRYLLDGHYMDSDAFHALPGSTIIDRIGYPECAPKG